MPIYGLIDPLYLIIVGPAILLAMIAQAWVKGAYSRWSRVANSHGLTGAEAAREMLSRESIGDVRIERAQGWLSDHFDPRENVLRLSPGVHDGRSVAAVGIACHEAGHALQHAYGYAPLSFRNLLVPVASVGSNLAWPIIIGGMLLAMFLQWPGGIYLAQIGVVVFGVTVVFQLVTLPVEFNASGRAKAALVRNGVITTDQEIKGVNAVLNAAAMTYIAATIAALAQLLYFALRTGLLGGRD
jgi:hypothetical protein